MADISPFQLKRQLRREAKISASVKASVRSVTRRCGWPTRSRNLGVRFLCKCFYFWVALLPSSPSPSSSAAVFPLL